MKIYFQVSSTQMYQKTEFNNTMMEYCKNMIKERLNEIESLEQDCKIDASKASNNKRYSRSITFLFGIVIIVIGAVTPSVPEKEQNLRTFLGTLTALAGAGVAIMSQYFDYTKSRQRALDLKELRQDLRNLRQNSQLELLKVDKKSEIKEWEEICIELQKEHKELEKRASQFGVGI